VKENICNLLHGLIYQLGASLQQVIEGGVAVVFHCKGTWQLKA